MKKILLALLVISFVGCNQGGVSKDTLAKLLKENPELIGDAIKAHPMEFMDAVQEAAKIASADRAKQREEEEKKKMEELYDSPLNPVIRDDENIRGTKGAPLTLVEYSDFQCPFCARALGTIQQLLKKYDGKIQFIYKHLPLDFHQQARLAAQYYEAIRIQNGDKAYQFHDEILKDVSKLRNGDAYLKSVAKKFNVDMKKLAKDINSAEVNKRIDEDIAEATKFGFQGTPGFLLNGIPVKGAYPLSHFEGIINELQKRGKVKL